MASSPQDDKTSVLPDHSVKNSGYWSFYYYIIRQQQFKSHPLNNITLLTTINNLADFWQVTTLRFGVLVEFHVFMMCKELQDFCLWGTNIHYHH